MSREGQPDANLTVTSNQGDLISSATHAPLLRQGVLDPPAEPGTWGRIDRFPILRQIGEGGMGLVFLARHPATGVEVAIKVMNPRLVHDPRSVQRFLTEARHMSRLSHPNILKVMDVSDRADGPYYVMPFMKYGSLADLLKPGKPLDQQTILRVARGVADGLAHAHEKGIIHRDLKPANVLLDKDGHACLADFGLVRTVFNDSIIDVRESHCEGTAAYMSPAVAKGAAEDTRCDIYSFGALLYEMLTGQLPYDGRSMQEVLNKIAAGPPPEILTLNPLAPSHLVRIAEGAMARELRERYASMADVVADLERAKNGVQPLGPRGAQAIVPAKPGLWCSKCGNAAADFDLFCNRCHAPLIRRFRLFVILQILLFLAAAVVMALVRQERLPAWCLHVPLLFIAQAIGFYLIHLSLRQPRFRFLLALFLIFVSAALAGFGTRSALLQAAPLYIGGGALVLWFRRRRSQTQRVSFQTLWIAFLISVLGLSQFLKVTSSTFAWPDEVLLPLQKIFMLYTPCLMLAGLALTFGIQSAMRVSARGIVVGEYLKSAHIVAGTRTGVPLLMAPLVAIGQALTAFYNGMIGVFAMLIRGIDFIVKLAQAYAIALGTEVATLLIQVVKFLALCLARVVIPFFLIAAIAQLTLHADQNIAAYVFSATWHGAMMLALAGLLMAAAIFGCVLCFARVSPPAFVETFLRDAAVISAYGLPLLLTCTFALHLGGVATRKYFEFDLPYNVGPFGWITMGLLGLAMLLLWQRRFMARAGRKGAIAGKVLPP